MRLRGPVMAIVWEQWRLVRGTVFAVTGIGLALMGGLHLLPTHTGGRWLLDYFNPMIAGGSFVMVCFFLLSDTERWELTGFRVPARQWQLPIKRELFLALGILVRLCAAALAAWVLGQSWLLASPPRHDSAFSAFTLSAAGTALLAVLFAVSALANRFVRSDRGAILAFLIWFVLSAAAMCGAVVYLREEAFEPRFAVIFGGLLSLVCTCITLAAGRKFDRPTVFGRVWGKLAVSPRADYWPGRFRTPAEAQSWYELRCHGLALPSLTMAGLVVAVMVAMVLNTRGISVGPFPIDGRDPVLFGFAITLGLWGWVVLPAVAVLAGLIRLSGESNAYRSNRVPYASLMPMGPAETCSIRLVSSFKWIGFTALLLTICLAGGLMILLTMASPSEIFKELSRTCGAGPRWPLLVALHAGAILAGAWSLYWLAAPLLGLVLWFGLLIGAGSLYALLTGGDLASERAFVVVAVLLPSLVLVLLTIRLAVYATRRRLLAPSTYAAIGLFPCALLLSAAPIQLLDGFWAPGRHSSLTDGLPVFDMLAALLVAVGALWLFDRVLFPGRLTAKIHLAMVALCGAASVLVQALPPANATIGVITVVLLTLTALCCLPVLAGLLQAYWVDRLRCR